MAIVTEISKIIRKRFSSCANIYSGLNSCTSNRYKPLLHICKEGFSG